MAPRIQRALRYKYAYAAVCWTDRLPPIDLHFGIPRPDLSSCGAWRDRRLLARPVRAGQPPSPLIVVADCTVGARQKRRRSVNSIRPLLRITYGHELSYEA